jgi:hypothetical protein
LLGSYFLEMGLPRYSPRALLYCGIKSKCRYFLLRSGQHNFGPHHEQKRILEYSGCIGSKRSVLPQLAQLRQKGSQKPGTSYSFPILGIGAIERMAYKYGG